MSTDTLRDKYKVCLCAQHGVANFLIHSVLQSVEEFRLAYSRVGGSLFCVLRVPGAHQTRGLWCRPRPNGNKKKTKIFF